MLKLIGRYSIVFMLTIGVAVGMQAQVRAATVLAQANPCNPCSMKKMDNPCGKKNPCNPCAGSAVKSSTITRPANAKAYKVTSRNHDEILERGATLWRDPLLSSNGLACQNCHIQGAGFNQTYAGVYPHKVGMVADQAGISSPISAEQMVQFCMVVPMAAKPLDWGSLDLAALTAYVEEVSQPEFATKMGKANPCAMKKANPCNPCGTKKMANPCEKKNPCNPCGMKH
jgi:cytochrome c